MLDKNPFQLVPKLHFLRFQEPILRGQTYFERYVWRHIAVGIPSIMLACTRSRP